MIPRTIGGVTLQEGTVLEVKQGDYQYGLGTVTIWVTEVLASFMFPDGQWVSIVGFERNGDGRWPDRTRFLNVRVSALRTAVVSPSP